MRTSVLCQRKRERSRTRDSSSFSVSITRSNSLSIACRALLRLVRLKVTPSCAATSSGSIEDAGFGKAARAICHQLLRQSCPLVGFASSGNISAAAGTPNWKATELMLLT